MPAESRGTATATGTTSPITVTSVPPPGPQSYVLVAVVISITTGADVTGITGGTGTFVKAAAFNMAASTKRIELWVGYGFGSSQPTQIVVSRAGATFNTAVVARTVDILGDASVAPTFTGSTPIEGNGTSADSGALTPAVGDILFAAVLLNTTAASSSARTHTGNAYLQNAAAQLTNVRVETGWCQAVSAVSSNENWTLSTAVAWVGLQVKWTPPAPPTPAAALLLKGMTTQAADAASRY